MERPRPLADLTVFEFGHSVAAPYAGLILADLGARVIKIENPDGGDYARGWGPPFWREDASIFHSLNRGKESISVDFSDPKACDALRRRILAEGDAVIQNLRVGVLAKRGIDPQLLLAEKPELVWCDIGAFGPGPLSAKPGYDPLMQAFAGVMSVTGEGARPPVRVGVSIMDMGAGMWSVIGMLAALIAKASTGRGGLVGTSLYETGISWMTAQLAGYCASGEVRKPYGSGAAEIVPYQAFSTRDGWLMVAAGNDNLFRRLCGAIDRVDLAADARYADNAGRVANRVALVAEIAAAAETHTVASLAAKLDEAGVPNAPIQTVDEVVAHPQTQALGMLEPVDGDTLPLAGIPVSFDGARPRCSGRAPALGEHNSKGKPNKERGHAQ
jgi:crotonobetainyl-CoA:carnitine CoA-transferase CaiB-like acyl-CoA transferase